MKNLVIKISTTLMLMLLISCGNEEPKNIIGAQVDYLIYTNAWDEELSVPLGIKRFPAEGKLNMGLGGLLAVSSPYDPISSSIYRLYVYDLACPHEKNTNVLLTIDDKMQAYCKKCSSVFSIINGDGKKLEGPSETGLQVYRAIHQNDRPGVFRVIR